MRVRTVLAATIATGTAIAAITAGAFAYADSRIVGGTPASETYSFMVSMQDQAGNHFCGAALIEPDVAVTAAHCVDGQNAADLQVRVGTTDRTQGGETAGVTEATIHPDYDPVQTGFNDVAVIKLDQQLTQEPVQIADTPADGTGIRLMGWGQTCGTRGCQQEPPVELQELETSVLADDQCEGADGPNELCVDSPNGDSGACFGDSGGPAVIADGGAFTLVGVTSRGNEPCGSTPAIYSDVAAQKAFIDQAAGGAGAGDENGENNEEGQDGAEQGDEAGADEAGENDAVEDDAVEDGNEAEDGVAGDEDEIAEDGNADAGTGNDIDEDIDAEVEDDIES
jgi:secreted trypsin-like serine protease